MLPEGINQLLKGLLEDHTGKSMDIVRTDPVGGGCINECFRVEAHDGLFFMKFSDATYPLEKGWSEGAEIANLYPLMVHLNLFGEGYLGSIGSVLGKFG
jgi:fructosamine-3-kinase